MEKLCFVFVVYDSLMRINEREINEQNFFGKALPNERPNTQTANGSYCLHNFNCFFSPKPVGAQF